MAFIGYRFDLGAGGFGNFGHIGNRCDLYQVKTHLHVGKIPVVIDPYGEKCGQRHGCFLSEALCHLGLVQGKARQNVVARCSFGIPNAYPIPTPYSSLDLVCAGGAVMLVHAQHVLNARAASLIGGFP
jgi:hypothetical protein